jgi:phosphatidylserine/phosphatidylglycerophosphate/cardiolipin synthase-like enzyme
MQSLASARRILYVVACLAPLSALEPNRAAHAAPATESVCFTPGGDCTQMIVAFIGAARREVLMQAYSFTSAPIAAALRDAKARGIDVRVIIDKSQLSDKYSGADFLAHAGIPVLIDKKHAIAHNKVIVVDRAAVETGSFNFTKAAQSSNAENALIINDPTLAEKYAQNWFAHAQHSDPYAGR